MHRKVKIAGRWTLTNEFAFARLISGQDAVAVILTHLGDVYLNEERFHDAERAFDEAFEIFKQSPANRIEVAVALRNLGKLNSLRRRNKEAMSVLNQAWSFIRVNERGEQWLAAEILTLQGVVNFREHKIGKAEALFTRAMRISSDSETGNCRLPKT
jgi:tetratricopeptide (TPR) repeat protein